jgi:hypothetical protein
VLQAMMMAPPEGARTSQELVQHVRQGRAVDNLSNCNYSAGLKNLIEELMERDFGPDFPQAKSTSRLAARAWDGMQHYRDSYIPEGQEAVVEEDEMRRQGGEDAAVDAEYEASTREMLSYLLTMDHKYNDRTPFALRH